MVVRTRPAGGATSEEIVYHVSSRPAKVKAFARAVRAHRGIKNRPHWSLDVTFAEDRSRVRKGHGPVNLGLLRRLVLPILQRDTSLDDSLRVKRQRAAETTWCC
jgi:predicted transposase YbfD/YdcC